MSKDDNPVLLFDGVCNLCNGIVRFVLPRDESGTIRFAPLQSEAGRRLLERAGLPVDTSDTVVLIIGGRYYRKSSAALEVAARLRGAWKLLRVLRIIPRPARDFVYDIVARSRYTIFGRRDACMMPLPEHRARFLDD